MTSQGIDVKRHSWDHLTHKIRANVRITVVDYSATQAKLYAPMGNDALPLFLSVPRPEWAKVRWINLQGMSWDCIMVRLGESERGIE